MEQFGWFTVDEWQAISSIATAAAFIVGAGSLLVAAGQLTQNKRATKDQKEQAAAAALDATRPYVLLRVAPGGTSIFFVELILENIGAGPAHDVEITVSPPLNRAREDDQYPLAKARIFREPITMLPPGYRLTSFLDSVQERHAADLPEAHDVRITYSDGRGHEWDEVSVIDFSLIDGLLVSERYGMHHVAKALRDIKDVLKSSGLSRGRELDVLIETRVERTRRLREERDEREKERQRIESLRPQEPSDD